MTVISPTRQADQLFTDLRRAGITIEQVDRVAEYVEHRPKLRGALRKIGTDLTQRFPSPAEIVLRLGMPGEIGLDDPQFVVRLPEYPRGTFDRLDEVSVSHEDTIHESEAWIDIVTDFRLPQHAV